MMVYLGLELWRRACISALIIISLVILHCHGVIVLGNSACLVSPLGSLRSLVIIIIMVVTHLFGRALLLLLANSS